jgi:hypothetical protein
VARDGSVPLVVARDAMHADRLFRLTVDLYSDPLIDRITPWPPGPGTTTTSGRALLQSTVETELGWE